MRTEGGFATLLVEVENANKAGAALLSDEECERAFAFGTKEHTAYSASSDGIGLGNVSLRILTRSARLLLTHKPGSQLQGSEERARSNPVARRFSRR